jgi:hypothetical protein
MPASPGALADRLGGSFITLSSFLGATPLFNFTGLPDLPTTISTGARCAFAQSVVHRPSLDLYAAVGMASFLAAG